MYIQAEDILPQRAPIVMIDALTSYTDSEVETTFLVREDDIFVEDGVMSECGVLEHIAQTCAARTGYISKYILKKPVDIGYIGQIKSMLVTRRPKVGETLTTRIKVLGEVFGITSITAVVNSGDETIARGSMKLATKQQ